MQKTVPRNYRRAAEKLEDASWFTREVLGSATYAKQDEMLDAIFSKARVSVAGANGCIGAETRILNADTGVWIPVGDISGKMLVWSEVRGHVVSAVAEKPFIKRVADLYQVTLVNGSSFTATLDHRLLTPDGWRSLRELRVGVGIAVSRSRSSSALSPQSVSVPSIQGPCARRCSNKALGSQSGCQSDSHLCDEQLPHAITDGRCVSPSPVGVRGYSPSYQHQDGQAYGAIRSRSCRSRAHLSRTHFGLMEGLSWGDAGYSTASLSSQPALTLSQAVRRANLFPSCDTSQGMGEAPRHVSESVLDAPCCSCQYLPSNYTIAYDAIADIRYSRTSQFYDLHVPGTENYLAEGVFHHNTGKDWMAARAILRWLTYYKRSKAIIIAPTYRQVNDVVWNEIRSAYVSKRIKEKWGLRIFRTAKIEDINEPQETFAQGFSTADPAKEQSGLPSGKGLQGFHSPHLLAVISEAHAVHQAHFDTIRRLLPQCILMTGNPFKLSGEFYDSQHSKRDNWHAIQISAFDTPNLQPDAPPNGWPEFAGMVTKTQVEQLRIDWGEDNPLYVSGVLGQFPRMLDDSIVPLYAAQEAVKREQGPKGPIIIACDVARFGKDKTIVYWRQGNHARIIYRAQKRNTQEIAGWIGNFIRTANTSNADGGGTRGADNNNLDYRSLGRVDTCVIDDTGVGGGVTDRLREDGLHGARLVAFQGGANATDQTHYVNATSEAWMRMRAWFLGVDAYEGYAADIENDQALLAQLTGRDYGFQGDRRIKIQSKDELTKSPDEADALSMTFVETQGRIGIYL